MVPVCVKMDAPLPLIRGGEIRREVSTSGYGQLIEKIEAIDARIPREIRARIGPLEENIRAQREEFQGFRDTVTEEMTDLRSDVDKLKTEMTAQQEFCATYNQILRRVIFDNAQRARGDDRTSAGTGRNGAAAAGGSGSLLTPGIPVADLHVCNICGKQYKRLPWYDMHFLNGVCQKEADRRSRSGRRRRRRPTNRSRVDDNSDYDDDQEYV